MKKELKEIFNEVMNLGMTLRQNQLSGWSGESGDDVLENYLKENEQRISKILDNPFEIDSKFSKDEKVKFTKECCEERDINQDSFGIIYKLYSLGRGKFSYYIKVFNGEEDFMDEFFNNELIKL